MRFLEFEKPIAELEGKIEELRTLSSTGNVNIASDINRLQNKAQKLLEKTYATLTPWQKVLVARHEDRPQFLDYLPVLVPDFEPLAGDRLFAEDAALVGGLGHFNKRPVVILGQQKGNTTETRLKHNFGMARPEGYRKAKRLIELADKFHLPLLSFVNTSGAYPGIDSEERGQSQAIASCIQACVRARIPLISVVLGEGGSGGAIAIATANRVLMLEHSVYSVISPEGCASILWKTAEAHELAASAQKLTAQDLLKLSVIDEIIPEPLGGAHRNKDVILQNVKAALERNLAALLKKTDFKMQREQKFISMGTHL
ncbi:acetyl-coenzyme A carboxylase carboxyl transferase subunit alpha [Alphaproteobacteria bacterium]|nr:acetyl-coenzyme A carboxylase carboxyl transferase subunit alpha [Alphaproteobacteria bacterium]GHS95541.1 acetyl-coenzyme A carboxylase carboxyl transferase subunit alpha [Alphaproteobacteria bacterium]